MVHGLLLLGVFASAGAGLDFKFPFDAPRRRHCDLRHRRGAARLSLGTAFEGRGEVGRPGTATPRSDTGCGANGFSSLQAEASTKHEEKNYDSMMSSLLRRLDAHQAMVSQGQGLEVPPERAGVESAMVAPSA